MGNIHQLDLAKVHLNLERWAAQYGPVYLFRLGSQRVVVLSNPKWCEQVLRARPEIFTRQSPVVPVFSEMGVNGVFSAEGDAWRTQRKLATFALAQHHLRSLYPKLQTVTTRLKERWERVAETGAPLDIVEELKRFTVDVTTLITFGYDINTVEQGNDVIQRKLELVFPALTRRLFALFPTWRLVRTPSRSSSGPRSCGAPSLARQTGRRRASAPRGRARPSREAVEFPGSHALGTR